jgi:ribulose-phosphate 3-epimerase
MSVNPGFGGQAFISHSLDKIKALKSRIDEQGLDIRIEVDGGINRDNIAQVRDAGADMFVAGSAIFNTSDYRQTISKLKQSIS